jgi:hypothetical protein
MKKTIILRTFLLVVLLLVPACRRWRSAKTHDHAVLTHKYNNKQVTDYILIINGIECKQCIRAVLKKLSKVPAVQHIDCTCPKNDYTKSRMECTVTKTVDGFPVELVKKILLVDDFVLASVLGEFSGTVTKAANNMLSFKLTGQELIVDFIANEMLLAELAQQQAVSREIKAVGVLDLENKRFTVEQVL